MSTSIRAFVAVRLPVTPPLRDVLGQLARMGRAIKTVAPENLHLTLKFLGDTDAGWIEPVCELLDGLASAVPAFDVTLRGLGAFPKPSRPSVIWTGVEPAEPLVKLADIVEQALTQFGFAAETRTFQPHVTLARVKARPPRELESRLESNIDTEFAKFGVKELSLVQSHLSPQGPEYKTIHAAHLKV